jgi:hypothetical protein
MNIISGGSREARMWKWITSSRANKVAAVATVALLALAITSLACAWHFRGQMQAAKKAEKVQQERADTLVKEGEARDAAFRKAISATEPALKSALAGVREAKASLAQAEAARRDPWIPPAVDNLAVRFDRAVEALR